MYAWNIPVIEDAAESLGTLLVTPIQVAWRQYNVSFNGNKVITTGGGGMLITDDEDLAER